ncbi:hypothetical protein D3C81_2188150 [compost metagenome]
MVSDLNISPAMWPMLPLPPEPYLSWSGWAFMYFTRSVVVLISNALARSALITSTFGVRATSTMGVKSLTGL